MKQFIKVFIFSFALFMLFIAAGIISYDQFFSPSDDVTNEKNIKNNIEEKIITENDTPLEKAIKNSNRINILLVGLEGTRSDTIMIASFDRKTKKANLISIPRDTYYPRINQKKYADTQKINAVYGMEKDGINALVKSVEEIVGIPIDNYATIDYDGVRAAVNAIGGVKVNVPFHMRYTDPYADPPLDINIPAGQQIIYGDKAMEFLRFRKSNYEGYSGYINGDLGRVQAQQEFIKSAIDKSLSLKLPNVISSVYPYIKTDMTLTDLLSIGKDVIGFSISNIESIVVPGTDKMLEGLSFYIVDGEETIRYLYKLYGVELSVGSD